MPSRAPRRPEIEIAVPASSEYLSVLRTAAAGLAASADFTIDDIEDLRIAVDEACSILLTTAIPGTELRCRFYLDQPERGSDQAAPQPPEPEADGPTVTVEARAHVLEPQPPSRSGFAWMVLTSLTSAVDVRIAAPDELTLILTHAGSTTKAR